MILIKNTIKPCELLLTLLFYTRLVCFYSSVILKGRTSFLILLSSHLVFSYFHVNLYSSVIKIKNSQSLELLLTLFYYTSVRFLICEPHRKNIISNACLFSLIILLFSCAFKLFCDPDSKNTLNPCELLLTLLLLY